MQLRLCELCCIVPLYTYSSAYSSLIRATVSSCEQTPVIFKRLHLKCNLIICQIATKSLPLQPGDGGVQFLISICA